MNPTAVVMPLLVREGRGKRGTARRRHRDWGERELRDGGAGRGARWEVEGGSEDGKEKVWGRLGRGFGARGISGGLREGRGRDRRRWRERRRGRDRGGRGRRLLRRIRGKEWGGLHLGHCEGLACERASRRENDARGDGASVADPKRRLDADDDHERSLGELDQLGPAPQIGRDKVLAPVARRVVEKVGGRGEGEGSGGGRGGRGDVDARERVCGGKVVGESCLARLREAEDRDEHWEKR